MRSGFGWRWALGCGLVLGCDAPSPSAPPAAEVKVAEAKVAEVKVAEVKAPEVKPPEVKAPEVKPPEVKAPDVAPPEVKPPEPAVAKPCRVLAISYGRPGGPGTALQRLEQRDAEPAASLEAWDPKGDQAPPVLGAAQLAALASQGPDGRWIAKDVPLTFALDHEGRPSLVTQTAALPPGVEVREVVYRHRCEPTVLDGEYPRGEDTYVSGLRWRSSAALPLHEGVRGPPTGATMQGRAKAKLRPAEVATVVMTPRPIVARQRLELAVHPHPGTPGPTPDPTVPLTVEAGTTLDHYLYWGEGTCLLGRDELRFSLNCYEEDLFDFGPEPQTAADIEVWVAPGKKVVGWLRVDESALVLELASGGE